MPVRPDFPESAQTYAGAPADHDRSDRSARAIRRDGQALLVSLADKAPCRSAVVESSGTARTYRTRCASRPLTGDRSSPTSGKSSSLFKAWFMFVSSPTHKCLSDDDDDGDDARLLQAFQAFR